MDARLELIVEGIAFGESPRWHDDRIWFCDWVDGDVRSAQPDGGDVRTHAHLDGFPICIDWDTRGRLLVVNGDARQLVRSIDDRLELFADLSPLSDRPWNEVVSHPSGNAYVNGIGYDMMAGETTRTGQIALVDPAGDARLVAEDLAFPNGMAINVHGTMLAVAESHAGRISAFTINESGDLTERRVFAEVANSAPDGICFAADGTLWYADVPNRHCRRVTANGDIVETIEVDRGCFSCAIAPNGDLYITATIWDTDTFTTRRGVLYRLPDTRPAGSTDTLSLARR